ncbi:hypothetical protein Q7O_001372 [Pectobacterium carotovorum subsp. carotovorum PCCS1]|nr:hypothetical protein [Pectobacterium carotovorum subsp. carotovorum PCCS1]
MLSAYQERDAGHPLSTLSVEDRRQNKKEIILFKLELSSELKLFFVIIDTDF